MAKIELLLDKGVYLFIKCYSSSLNIRLNEAVRELIRLFRFISGDETGLKVLEEIVSREQYTIPVLGKPVKIEVELGEQELEYVLKVSKILGVNVDTALKICIATLARLLQECFPHIKCRLKGTGFARFRLLDFKEMVRSHKNSIGTPEPGKLEPRRV